MYHLTFTCVYVYVCVRVCVCVCVCIVSPVSKLDSPFWFTGKAVDF
jgi:hypothetical protein